MRATVLWVVLLAVTTQAKIVYQTEFENGGQLPEGWAVESHGPGADWAPGGNPQDWHMRVRYGPGGDQDEWLVSPLLDLSGEQGVSVQFWQWFRTYGQGVAQVRVSIDGGQTWATAVEYSSDQFGEPEVPVPQADGQSNVRFCWRYLASNDYQWDVDDVRVHAEVPVDLEIVGARGPTDGDYIRQHADLVVRLTFRNLGSQPSPMSTVHLSTPHGSVAAALPSGIAPDDTLAVQFTATAALLPVVGDAALSVVVSAPGDAVAGNDSLTIGPLHVTALFPSPATTILNYDDSADSALFAAILTARGEQYNCWNRKQGGSDRNLYGLEAWRVVIFTETEIYPARCEQLAMMRFLDQPAPGARRGLLMSGDDWARYSETGAVLAEFIEEYLGMGGGQQITTDMPSLYPVPSNAIGFDQTLSTNAVNPDVLLPNPSLPTADLALAYDQALSFGAMGTFRTTTYQTVAAGFEWGQLIVHNEQLALASACVDWMLTAAAERGVGELIRLDLNPNPATDRVRIRVPEPAGPGRATASLVDMSGREAAAWDLPAVGPTELRLPHCVSAGAYCLVVAPGTGAKVSERVVVWR